MTEQVMIYEIKSSAAANAEVLFSDDNKNFFWNDEKFTNLKQNDFVFVVNRHKGYVLFTKFHESRISTELNQTELVSRFEYGGKVFEPKAPTLKKLETWRNFIRLEILNKLEIPSDWKWKSFGAAENTYLNGDKVSMDSPQNRILNIEQLSQLTEDDRILKILESSRQNFENTSPPTPAKNKKSIPNFKNEMNILTAIKTKPFILLAGLSGTGKSRLVRTLAFKTCPTILQDKENKKPGNFELIPVRPNWHDSSELMGYVSRIDGEKYITTSFLQFIAKAWKYLDTPFFLCLDEMNLAPVEQYFAEYLSIIETRQVKSNEIVTDYIIARSNFENKHLYNTLLEDLNLSKDDFPEGIGIPKNLVVIGTVNMDETTHSFSRKVLDRAMTFEMNEVNLFAGLDVEQNDWSYPIEILDSDEVLSEFTSGAEVYNGNFNERNEVLNFLQEMNQELEGTPFKIAYRVRDEFLIYCYHASQKQSNSNWLNEALDEMTCMKILSRIEGDENKTQNVLSNLLKIIKHDFKRSHAKLLEMEKRLHSSGYTSFWS